MFANNSYGKVWRIYPIKEKGQKFTTIQMSTSRKNKDGSYTTDFSDYVKCVGKAHEKAAELESKDSIKIVKCGVTKIYDKEKDRNYETFILFDFEFANEKKNSGEGSYGVDSDGFMELPDDAKLPFED